MEAKQKKITERYADSKFTTVGLCVIIYELFVLIAPLVLKNILILNSSPILNDEILYIGIYFVILVVGTLIPFFILMAANRIKLGELFKSVNVSFLEIFGEALVFITLASLAIFITNSITSYFGLSSSIIFNVGIFKDELYLESPIFVFMVLIACPILEGFAFRGVILKSLAKYGKNFAIYMSALLFALAHTSFQEMLPAFVIGVLLGRIAIYHDSIQTSIIINIIFNLFVGLLGLVDEKDLLIVVVLLLLVYVISIILLYSMKYSIIKIKSSPNLKEVSKTFLTNPFIIISIIIFVIHSFLYRVF